MRSVPISFFITIEVMETRVGATRFIDLNIKMDSFRFVPKTISIENNQSQFDKNSF